ncbi:hypothetical protein AVO42_00355 [Thiomicrospira sp. XS5]|uniref:hypothetical protein n=1 Tax=Thiomicrospira sp. XS5 TaxID=1775636 RepID=UPI00074647ED|nr:hypothetical protein [Thiomicrospira sp. XS5]KUJ73907.1 hypothetical protein AVO42_00355 [Thiomicrospira sp. XS5]
MKNINMQMLYERMETVLDHMDQDDLTPDDVWLKVSLSGGERVPLTSENFQIDDDGTLLINLEDTGNQKER